MELTTAVGSYADVATIKLIAAHNAAAASPSGIPLPDAALDAVLVAPVGTVAVNSSAGAKKPALPAPTPPGATPDSGAGVPVPRAAPDPSAGRPVGADKSTRHGVTGEGGSDDASADGDAAGATAASTPPPTPNAVPSPVVTSVLGGTPRGLIGGAIAALRRASVVETTEDGAAGDADPGASPDNPLAALVAVGHSLFGLESSGGDNGGGARV